MKSIKFLSLFILLTSVSAFAEKPDGVMFDENGLTIIRGEKPLVDSNRWNYSDGLYTLTSGVPGYVKVLKDATGKVMAVRKSFAQETQLFADGVFSESNVTITSKFCDQIDDKKFDLQAKRCQYFLTDLFKAYEDQASEASLKTLQEVAKLDGISPIASIDALKMSLKNQTFVMKLLEGRSVIANIGYISQRCAALKRYSSDDAPASVVAPAAAEEKASSPK